MTDRQPKNPMHGVTLEQILNVLVEKYGWEEMASRITIKCFSSNPSVKSSLAFLRKTPWARTKVERLYVNAVRKKRKTSRLRQAPKPRPEGRPPQEGACPM